MVRINIDNLNIRLKGYSVKEAKTVGTEIGNQLRKQIDWHAHQQPRGNEKASAHFDVIDTGVIITEHDSVDASRVSELIASKVVNSVFDRINQTCEEEKK